MLAVARRRVLIAVTCVSRHCYTVNCSNMCWGCSTTMPETQPFPGNVKLSNPTAEKVLVCPNFEQEYGYFPIIFELNVATKMCPTPEEFVTLCYRPCTSADPRVITMLLCCNRKGIYIEHRIHGSSSGTFQLLTFGTQ